MTRKTLKAQRSLVHCSLLPTVTHATLHSPCTEEGLITTSLLGRDTTMVSEGHTHSETSSVAWSCHCFLFKGGLILQAGTSICRVRMPAEGIPLSLSSPTVGIAASESHVFHTPYLSESLTEYLFCQKTKQNRTKSPGYNKRQSLYSLRG